MTRLHRLLVVGGIAFSAIVLTLSGLYAWQARTERKAAIDEADSLRIAHREAKAFVVASDLRAEQWKGIAERADSISRAKDQRVAQLQFRNRQLDSVLRVMPNATASDSLQVYKQKVDNLTDQVIEIGVSRDSARSAMLSERQRARELSAGKDSAMSMLTAVEASNFRLRTDLAAASPPCKWLPFVKCPSRKLVFVVGVGSGLVLGYYVRKR